MHYWPFFWEHTIHNFEVENRRDGALITERGFSPVFLAWLDEAGLDGGLFRLDLGPGKPVISTADQAAADAFKERFCDDPGQDGDPDGERTRAAG